MTGNPPRYDPPPPVGLFTIKHRKPVPCDDLLKWGMWMEKANIKAKRKVRRTHLKGCYVSTVFLGIDHNHTMNGPPVLFETMVFSGEGWLDIQERCSTWRQALKQHWNVVSTVKAGSLQ